KLSATTYADHRGTQTPRFSVFEDFFHIPFKIDITGTIDFFSVEARGDIFATCEADEICPFPIRDDTISFIEKHFDDGRVPRTCYVDFDHSISLNSTTLKNPM